MNAPVSLIVFVTAQSAERRTLGTALKFAELVPSISYLHIGQDLQLSSVNSPQVISSLNQALEPGFHHIAAGPEHMAAILEQVLRSDHRFALCFLSETTYEIVRKELIGLSGSDIQQYREQGTALKSAVTTHGSGQGKRYDRCV